MSEDDYKSDELIDVKLPRKDLDTLRRILEREDAYSWFGTKIKSWWVWAVAGGVLTFASLYHEIIGMFK